MKTKKSEAEKLVSQALEIVLDGARYNSFAQERVAGKLNKVLKLLKEA